MGVLRPEKILEVFLEGPSNTVFVLYYFSFLFQTKNHVISFSHVSGSVEEDDIKVSLFYLVKPGLLAPHHLLLFVNLLDTDP